MAQNPIQGEHMRRITLRPSPAMIVATIALLFALGGTGVAATVLAHNSVGTAQLKNSAVTNSKIASNAVTTAKVKNHSLLRTDFASGQIPAGPRGPVGLQGARGPTGPAGPAGTAAATKWALVGKDGNLIAGSPGVTITHPTAGNFFVNFGSALTGHAVIATQAYRDADATFAAGSSPRSAAPVPRARPAQRPTRTRP